MDNIMKEVVFQVLRKVSVADGDILIVRCDPEILGDLAVAMKELLHPKRVLLVHEDVADVIGDIDKETMNALGWYQDENTPRS